MPQASQIIAELETLTAFIEDAQFKLSKGEVINISHVDAKVAQLCDQALSLKPADATQVQPAMADMISRLEQLGLALQDFQAHLKEKLK